MLRYRFDFAGSHAATNLFSFTLGFLDMDDDATGTGVFNGDIPVNHVNVGSFAHSVATINTPFASNTFTLADIGATAGAAGTRNEFQSFLWWGQAHGNGVGSPVPGGRSKQWADIPQPPTYNAIR